MTNAAETPPRLVSHVSVGVSDLHRAAAFYDAALAPLGVGRTMEHALGVSWGRGFPEFWASVPHDGAPASAGNGVHVCFAAQNRQAVDAFHAAGLATGGADAGAPGFRLEYAPGYYGAFLRDPDGNKVEALAWIDATPA